MRIEGDPIHAGDALLFCERREGERDVRYRF